MGKKKKLKKEIKQLNRLVENRWKQIVELSDKLDELKMEKVTIELGKPFSLTIVDDGETVYENKIQMSGYSEEMKSPSAFGGTIIESTFKLHCTREIQLTGYSV